MATKNHQCPQCKGDGKITLTVKHLFSDEPDEISKIDCPTCDGNGTVDDETLQLFYYEKSLWCTCGNKNGSYYVPDGKGVIDKHHWLCNDCNKITQIG